MATIDYQLEDCVWPACLGRIHNEHVINYNLLLQLVKGQLFDNDTAFKWSNYDEQTFDLV